MLTAKNICKGFDGLGVLKGISLTLNRGEVMALIGPSGSGKSTFLRCMNQLEPIDSGEVTLDGIPMCRMQNGRLVYSDEKTLRSLTLRMGMVFQQYNLFPHMNVMQNLIDAPMRVKKMPKGQAVDKARALLDKVGLLDKAEQYPGQLSGGQQQRVALARALCCKPKLLLCDEPTGALDPASRDDILALLDGWNRRGNTVVVITHDPVVAAQAATRYHAQPGGQLIRVQ